MFNFFNKKKYKGNNQEIVYSMISRQNKDIIENKELSNILIDRLSSGIKEIKESKYNIEFIFNDGWEYSSWNSNKSSHWLSHDNVLINNRGEKINYSGSFSPSLKVMEELMIASYDEKYKISTYKLPIEIEDALLLKNKAETILYSIKDMENLTKQYHLELEKDKNEFKKKYGADILEILFNFNK